MWLSASCLPKLKKNAICCRKYHSAGLAIWSLLLFLYKSNTNGHILQYSRAREETNQAIFIWAFSQRLSHSTNVYLGTRNRMAGPYRYNTGRDSHYSDVIMSTERDGVSNHRHHDYLLNCLFRCRSKETSKLRGTDLCEGNSPHKWPVMRKMLPLDDVIMWGSFFTYRE